MALLLRRRRDLGQQVIRVATRYYNARRIVPLPCFHRPADNEVMPVLALRS